MANDHIRLTGVELGYLYSKYRKGKEQCGQPPAPVKSRLPGNDAYGGPFGRPDLWPSLHLETPEERAARIQEKWIQRIIILIISILVAVYCSRNN